MEREADACAPHGPTHLSMRQRDCVCAGSGWRVRHGTGARLEFFPRVHSAQVPAQVDGTIASFNTPRRGVVPAEQQVQPLLFHTPRSQRAQHQLAPHTVIVRSLHAQTVRSLVRRVANQGGLRATWKHVARGAQQRESQLRQPQATKRWVRMTRRLPHVPRGPPRTMLTVSTKDGGGVYVSGFPA